MCKYDQEYDELSKIKGLKAAFRVMENLDDVILKDNKKAKVEERVSFLRVANIFNFIWF